MSSILSGDFYKSFKTSYNFDANNCEWMSGRILVYLASTYLNFYFYLITAVLWKWIIILIRLRICVNFRESAYVRFNLLLSI